MEPDHWESRHTANKKAADDAPDSPPIQSLECLEYLRKVQQFQVKMIAIRVRMSAHVTCRETCMLMYSCLQMNKFCRVALYELLGLRLNDCPIEKRLQPVVDYLDRHRVALQKYVYPECFSAIMENVWECLLQVHTAVSLSVSLYTCKDLVVFLIGFGT